MSIHYHELSQGGLKAAYLCEPGSDPEAVVRAAFHMQYVEPTYFSDIALGRDAYVVDGPLAKIFHQPLTQLNSTSYTASIPKDGSSTVIGIRTASPLAAGELEVVIKTVLIHGELIPAGLVPIPSKREQIPSTFLMG